jgi:cob(I)alamin adenosyltransferase
MPEPLDLDAIRRMAEGPIRQLGPDLEARHMVQQLLAEVERLRGVAEGWRERAEELRRFVVAGIEALAAEAPQATGAYSVPSSPEEES